MGKQWRQWQTLFAWAPKSPQMGTSAMKLNDACSSEEKLWHTYTALAETLLCWQSPNDQSYGFPGSHVWMWELKHKEGWAPYNWCLWIVVVVKTLESTLDCKEIKPVNPKENQSWIFIRTDAEAEALKFWPPDAKNWVAGKDPDAG